MRPKKIHSSHPDVLETFRRPAQAPSLGVRFTDEEEKAIRRAMRDSIRYMATYGQGYRPAAIDLSHFNN